VGDDEVNWSVWGSGEGKNNKVKDEKTMTRSFKIVGESPLVRRR
jgi:hypothetical protein